MNEGTTQENGTALAGRDSSVLLGGDIPPDGHPLRELGKRLADLLDDDHWNNCEPLLLAAWEQEQRLEALCDTNYAAGVGAGWNCGVAGDADRRDRIIEAHSRPALERLRALKTPNA